MTVVVAAALLITGCVTYLCWEHNRPIIDAAIPTVEAADDEAPKQDAVLYVEDVLYDHEAVECCEMRAAQKQRIRDTIVAVWAAKLDAELEAFMTDQAGTE